MALAQMRGAGEALMAAGLLVPHGASSCVVAEDDLDDMPVPVINHPITGHPGHLGNSVWQDERTSARRRVHALDMMATARRTANRLDCTLGDDPVPYLGGAALDFDKPPKRLLVYRTTEPFAGIRRAPLEMLCLGQQFVAYAEHPDTGQPYAWPDEGLADLDIESLPEIDAEQAAAFLDETLALIPPELRPKSLGAKRANGAGHPCLPAHAQAGTLAAIRSALAWLPNAELDYDSWMRIGMALKGALGEEGATLFAEWSAQAAKNDPAATAQACASRPGSTRRRC